MYVIIKIRDDSCFHDAHCDCDCVTYMNSTISEDCMITFENDGNGIDVEKHPENGILIPKIVFGHLRISPFLLSHLHNSSLASACLLASNSSTLSNIRCS